MADDTGSTDGRTTAPMSAFSGSAVRIGIIIFIIGLLIAFGIPALLL